VDDEQREARRQEQRVVKPGHLRRGGRGRGAEALPGEPGGDGPDPGTEVRGRVEAGVEHGSVVLRGEDGSTWQLGAGRRDLVGCVVVVRGRPRPDVLTTAQQGVPLEVLDVEVVSGTPRRQAPDS
jgi:hypothetical protein